MSLADIFNTFFFSNIGQETFNECKMNVSNNRDLCNPNSDGNTHSSGFRPRLPDRDTVVLIIKPMKSSDS